MLGLNGPKFGIKTAGAEEGIMIPHFQNPTRLYHRDRVSLADRRKPMGNDQASPARQQMFQRQLDLLLGRGIHTGRGLVEDKNRRILQQGTRDRKSLPFPGT